MPIYEFICRWDGVVEILLPLSEWERKQAPCPHCGRASRRIPASECVMKPDSMWAGQKNQYGYFTSAKSLKAEMARRNHVEARDRTDLEGMDKVAEQAQHAKEEKSKKRIRGVMERAFGPSGLGLGGADGAKLVKETLEKGR